MLYIPCPFAGEGCWTLFGKTPFNLLNYLTLNIMLPLNVLAACRVMGLIANKVFLRELHKKRHDGQGIPAPSWVKANNFCCKYLARSSSPPSSLAVFFKVWPPATEQTGQAKSFLCKLPGSRYAVVKD